MRIVLALILIVFSESLSGQSYEQYMPIVKKNNRTLYNVGVGPLVSPQFSQMDFNNDGKQDLFVFDRAGNQTRVFLYEGNTIDFNYRYDASYESFFPKMQHFALLRDFNEDGLLDVFTLSDEVSGVEVWKNVGNHETPKFEKVVSTDFDFDVLTYKTSSDKLSNIYVSTIDVPAIHDIDNDGDLDILTFEQAGGKMHFYQNMCKENGLAPEVFQYELRDDCYGKFYESEFTEEVILSSDKNLCAQGFRRDEPQMRHSGSTTLVFDPNGDGIPDLLIGDLASSNLAYLENGGTATDAWIKDQEVKYPVKNPVQLDIFNGAYEIDVDNDGRKDLLVAPNNALASDDTNNIWYYKNTSSGKEANYELITKSFLEETRLNLGKFTYPVLVDYNADGLSDILVGSSGYTQGGFPNGRLFLFEQKHEGLFEMVDDDYLGMSTLTDENLKLAPSVGDIDGDGDDDLIVANSIGFLFFFENVAGRDLPYDFAQYQYKFENIRPGLAPRPQLFDLDGDDLIDIISGEKNDNQSEDGSYFGGVNFYKNNNGSFDSNVNAEGNTPVLGGIYTREVGVTTTGESSPFFVHTNDGIQCVVGTASGKIKLYDNVKDNLYGKFNIASDSLPVKDFGQTVSATLGNLDHDAYYEMVIGTAAGGLYFYQTELKLDGLVSTVEVQNAVDLIYPNPVTDYVNIEMDDVNKIEVYNMNAQLVLSSKQKRINTQSLQRGLYIVKAFANDKVLVTKMIKK